MLLNELTGVKKYYNKSEYQLERLLKKFGINFVAGGKYGKIFTHTGWDYVVKLFRNDPYYLSFVNYAIAHPNKHYPKFLRKPLEMHAFNKRSVHSASKFTIVKIEKLTELDKQTGQFIVDNLERAVQAWYDKNHGKGLDDDKWTFMFVPEEDGGEWKKVPWPDVFKRYPWLESLAEAWHNIFQNIEEGAPDIHKGNFMKRQDGTIVIIDPLWQGSNPMADYQAYLDRESAGMSDYEPPEVQGPAYIQKRQQAAIEATRALAKQFANSNEDNGDIPF